MQFLTVLIMLSLVVGLVSHSGVKLEDGLQFSYNLTDTSITATVVFDVQGGNGYVALGFPSKKNSMVGADAIICSNDFGFKAYHLPSYSKSTFTVKPDTYTTDSLCSCVNNECTLKFTRELVLAGDGADTSVTITDTTKDFNLLFAAGTQFSGHSLFHSLRKIALNNDEGPSDVTSPAVPPGFIPILIFLVLVLISWPIHQYGDPAFLHKSIHHVVPFLTLGNLAFCIGWLTSIIFTYYYSLSNGANLPQVSGNIATVYLLFTFAITARSGVWISIFGIPLERSIIFHIVCGLTVVGNVVVHFYSSYFLYGIDRLKSFEVIGKENVIPMFGIFANLSMFTVVISSLFRRKHWDGFYIIHKTVSGFFLLFVILHRNSPTILAVVVPFIAIFVIDQLIRMFVTSSKASVKEFSAGGNKMTSLTLIPEKSSMMKYEAGSYYFIQVMDIDRIWHPFSIINGPGSSSLTFCIKDMGVKTWTGKLHALAKGGKSLSKVNINGPYGKVTLSCDLTSSVNRILLFAGGIGVTPMMSIFIDLLAKRDENPNLTEVKLIWTTRDNLELVDNLLEMIGDDNTFSLDIYFTGKDNSLIGSRSVKTGRPNVGDILSEVKEGNNVSVLACGPAPMVKSVERMALINKFNFHKETFLL